MKIQNRVAILALASLLLSCGGGKKQTLGAEEVKTKIVAPKDSLQRSNIVYNAAEDTQYRVVESQQIGKRIISPNLKRINLTQAEPVEKEINLDNFYTKANYIILKHPLADEGMGYLGDAEVIVTVIDGGMMTIWNYSSDVYLAGDYILIGDTFMGYHVYNKLGEFIYTLTNGKENVEYNLSANRIDITTEKKNFRSGVFNLAVWNNKAIINVNEDSINTTHIYDVALQKGINAFKNTTYGYILGENTFLASNPNVREKDQQLFLTSASFSESNQVMKLTKFGNYNPPPTTKGRRGAPESTSYNYSSDILTVRQAFNDTIYKVKDTQTLEAIYVLNSGKMKLSNTDAHSENKEGKLIISDWLETDDFLFIKASVDQDFPNNRTNEKVSFRYYYYNKGENKLYLKESKKIYPEEYTFGCDIDGAIPFLVGSTKVKDKKLYTSFNKRQLQKMMDSSKFKSYSQKQQDKITSLHNELSDDALLLMILE